MDIDDLETARLVIADYKMDFAMPSLNFANRSVFEQYSVIRWVCDELWDYIFRWSDGYSVNLLSIIADFRHKIHSCIETSKRTEKIFMMALDVVDDIEDLLCGIVADNAKKEFEKENDYGFI